MHHRAVSVPLDPDRLELYSEKAVPQLSLVSPGYEEDPVWLINLYMFTNLDVDYSFSCAYFIVSNLQIHVVTIYSGIGCERDHTYY